MKYRAWGWQVLEIDGNNVEQIREALTTANASTEKPTLIVGHTVMGKGLRTAEGESFEDKVSTHGQPVTAAGASIEATIKNLGGDAENPFQIFPEVAEVFAERANALREEMVERKKVEVEWRQANPALAIKLDTFLSGKLPEIDYRSIAIKSGSATRAASATVSLLGAGAAFSAFTGALPLRILPPGHHVQKDGSARPSAPQAEHFS